MSDNKNHGQSPLFEIIFQDGSIFKGGNSLYETNWLNIPINKPIKRVFYLLPNNDHLCLSNYSKYFRMSEACKDITGKNRGIVRIQYDYIMGQKDDKITCYRITLSEDKDARYKTNDITIRIFEKNSKFISGLNIDNWRG